MSEPIGSSSGSGRRMAIMAAVAVMILSVPLVAMQFTTEVHWSPADFAVFAAMLAVAGAALEVGFRTARNLAYRAGAAIAVGGVFFMVWVSLAVGIVSDSGDLADLVYLAVIPVGLVGAAFARLRPAGMARAMAVVALAQAVVAAFFLSGLYKGPIGPTFQIVGLNGLFGAFWVASALLFKAAARARPA